MIYLLAAIFTIFAWWLSTGIVLYLNKQSASRCRWSFMIATSVALACLYGLHHSSQVESVSHVYIAFTQALIVWGWCEMCYFMGYITGPCKTSCPPNITFWQRFTLAIKTSLYHEILVISVVAILMLLTWNQPNQFGFWTFIILWIMRWSSKLNIFLGVSNINKEWIPDHLRYIFSYSKQRAMNVLFPFSILLSSILTYKLITLAISKEATNFQSSGFIMLSTILSLAILEHLFLMFHANESALWNWSLKTSNH